MPIIYCSRNCSREAKYIARNGTAYCARVPAKCPIIVKKHQDTLKKKSRNEWEEIVKKRQETCLRNFGADNPQKVPEIRQRSEKTIMEKYGVKNVSQSEEIKQKKKDTSQERWGADSHMKTEKGKLLLKKAFLQKYGVDNPLKVPEIREKIKKTCLEKYGVDNPNKSPEVREKARKTCLRKYGVHNPGLDPEIAEKAIKNGFRNKDYLLPSGKIIKVRGYEPYALDILFETYNEEQIQTTKIPYIPYIFEGKERRYFPDIYIPSENRIIEVKSTYTVKDPKVEPKRIATLAQGYAYEIWVIDNKQILEII